MDEEWVDAFSALEAGDGNIRANDTRLGVAELVDLLQELDRLERARGTERFDPWALLAVRSEIRATMQENKAIQRLLGADA